MERKTQRTMGREPEGSESGIESEPGVSTTSIPPRHTMVMPQATPTTMTHKNEPRNWVQKLRGQAGLWQL